jgi:hypothetical protein
MDNSSENTFRLPWVFIGITCIPIFAVALLFPAHVDSEYWGVIDRFIDTHLLGVVGLWSSQLPFSSKVITNYISLFGPLFGLIYIYRLRNAQPKNASYYTSMSFLKYIVAAFGLAVFTVFITWVGYFSFEDIAIKRKMGVFGVTPLMYALFSSGVLVACYISFMLIFIAYYFLPRIFYIRYFGKK